MHDTPKATQAREMPRPMERCGPGAIAFHWIMFLLVVNPVHLALFTLAGIHVLAAFWHRFVLRDGVLARMLPGLGGHHEPLPPR